MIELFEELLTAILENSFELLDDEMLLILDGMLRIEHLGNEALSNIFSSGRVDSLYQFIYTFACSLIALKFLWRGFEIWILWRNGDADNSPQDMLIGVAQAIAVMVCFPFLYDIAADVTVWFADGVLNHLGLSSVAENFFGNNLASLLGKGFLFLILVLVYVVISIVLYVKLLRRGFELLVLRVGLPFACLGLLDSDYGVFRSYIQTLYRTLFTSIVQVCLISLSARLLLIPSIGAILLSLAALSTAYGTPALLQNILIPMSHGGGITNKIYTTSMAVRGIRGLFGR